MKSNSNLNVFFLGSSGFPYGFANIERQKLISMGLVNAGAKVTILNRKGVHTYKAYPDLKPKGIHEGVKYEYLSGSPYRQVGFIKRNLTKATSLFKEIRLLIIEKRHSKLNVIIFNARNFSSLIYYYLISKFLNVPVAFNYVELNSAMENRSSIWYKLNDYLFENIGIKLIPIILPISEYIYNFSLEKNPSASCLKIPTICDFEKFDENKEIINEKYILFCGAASYFETISFVIDSYHESDIKSHSLYLILNGAKKELLKVKEYCDKLSSNKRIKYFSDLPYDKLIAYYKSAHALVIPLRPILRDKARFPHKIGEYSASGRPIISNNFGEVSVYFTGGKDAAIANSYDVSEYAEKIKMVIDDVEFSNELALNSKSLGKKYFDYKVNGIRLFNLFKLYLQD